MTPSPFTILILIFSFLPIILCWSSEDLELFDLVESSNEKFYDILGVDPKASASDIRKAYRRLSAVYHPDRNKDADAEQTFRKIAAIADVLRNEERRKKYDLILQTGLPDWRQPIYYYRRVKNMGLLQLVIFLLVLFTVGQYLLAWSAYWEKKYEMEELVLSKLKKKAKHQRKGRLTQADGDMYVAEITCNLPKPRCQDLFPVRLFYYFMHMLKLTPHYIKIFQQCFCSKVTKTNVVEEEEEEESQETRFKTRKYIKPPIPDYSETDSQDHVENMHVEDIYHDHQGSQKLKKSCLLNPNETDFHELKKAMKKYPNGTLQRWEKIAGILGCSTSEVATMAKHMKSLPYSRSIPISVQGLTGAQEENVLLESHEKTTNSFYLNLEQTSNSSCKDSSLVSEDKSYSNGIVSKNFNSENFWKQEQQLALEIALQKFPKDVKARWDKIAASIPGKTKEECIARYKLLVQQIKKKKSKET